MTTRIRTADAELALRSLIESEVLAASGGNSLVSRAEGLTLSAYVHRVELTLRAEGGSGTRVHVDRLIERAFSDALAVWNRFNPPEATLDHMWLARDELASITRADPELGEITTRALSLMSGSTTSADPAALLSALRAEFEALDLFESPDPPDSTRVDARQGQSGRRGLSAAVTGAFDYYYRVEDRDIGSARLYRMDRSGQRAWAILVSTDGDDGYLELLDSAGAWLAGARTYGGRLVHWDELTRRTRFSRFFMMLHGYQREEGLSEEAERAAAGQPPNDWTGDVRITDGSLTPAGRLLGAINTGSAVLNSAQQELACAALDHLWEMLLRYRAPGTTSLLIAANRQGTLALGNFTRPTTGVTYETAYWRDIDDGSFVLYYARDSYGLYLAIEQFDN